MFIYRTTEFTIYFGDAQDNLYQHDYFNLGHIKPDALINHPLFKRRAGEMGLTSLAFLRQTHSIQGHAIDNNNIQDLQSFVSEGDYLISNQSHVGLGVMTADCLPIVFYDPHTNAVGIAHAGWRGTVDGIAVVVLKRMHQEYKTDPAQVQVFFGPSARACCYEVSPDFIKNIRSDFIDKVIVDKAGTLFFDVSEYNRLLLQEHGVNNQAINADYNICTIDDESFFSYRRQGPKAGRQMTIVAADQIEILQTSARDQVEILQTSARDQTEILQTSARDQMAVVALK